MEQVQTEGFPRIFSHPRGGADFGGGLVTFPNFFAIPPNATPNCLDVKFGIGGIVEKRLGSTTLNATVLISSAATGFLVDSGGTLAVSLQAYWKLDEQSGNRLDSFGTNNLTPANNPGFGTGLRGNAASFLAANTNNLSAPHTTALAVGSYNFTFVGWIYPTSGANLANNPSIVSKGQGATPQNVDWEVRLVGADSGCQLQVYDTLLAQTVLRSANSLLYNSWNMVTCWHDSANGVIGVRVNTATATSASYTGGLSNLGGDFTLAANRTDLSTLLINGSMDEVGFWHKVLTNQEIIDLWNGGSANTYNSGVSNAGFGMFDFGAGFGADGKPLRWLVVSAGSGIYASSNRGVTFVVIATDRGADFQYFERSKSLLIATSETQNKVLYWAGSVGTFMAALPVGSAPPTKHALDFGGFLLLMNDSANKRRVTYADNTKILSDPFTTTFELPGQLDDEITEAITYNRSAYGFTKYTVSRISSVGGNPDFAVQPVKAWGAIQGTIKRVTYTDVGEVMICLGWDRHVRIFDGTEDRIISTPIEEPNNISPVYLNGIERTALHRCRAEVDTEEQVYRLLLPMAPSSQTTHTVCLNLRTGAWYPYLNTQNFNAMVMAESGNSRILSGVTRGGFVHWINTTNTDAGTAINEYYESGLLHGQTPRVLSKAQKMVMYFSPTSSGTIYYQEAVNFAATFDPPRDRIMLTDSTSVTQIRKVIDLPVMQNVYRYRLSSSASTTTPWRLLRFDLEGKDLGIGAA